MGSFSVQKIKTTSKTLVDFAGNNHSSMTLTNSHATDSIIIDLYVTSQFGTAANGYITNPVPATGVYAAETEVASTILTQLTIDNGSGAASTGTSDMFLDERVYKSDGTLFGICTTFNSTVLLTFNGGLVKKITDNDILYVGTRHYLLRSLKIPKGTSLKLEQNEFSFNNAKYNMYIKSDNADGGLDIITRY
tara:strand:- start:1054 stop:1629 length:576 start_codon:yes stop_codon:yes gene_type:complete